MPCKRIGCRQENGLAMKSPAYIIQPEEIDATSQVGGKAAALAALRDTDLAIPAWFVLSTAAFYDSLSKPERMALAAAGDRLFEAGMDQHRGRHRRSAGAGLDLPVAAAQGQVVERAR